MNEQYEIKLLEANTISRAWKSLHIILLICVAIFGICGGIILSFLYDEEDFLCATPIITKTVKSFPEKHQTIINGSAFKLDFLSSGVSNESCEYTEYALITSFIFASIWVVFFMMCGRGGKSHDGLPKPWRIVLPALVFCTIMSLTSLGACTQLTVASNSFCYSFDIAMTYVTNKTYTNKCEDLNLFMKINQISYLSIQTVVRMAEVMAWLCMTSWVLSAALCLLRILRGPDFQPVLLPFTDVALTESDCYKVLSSSSKVSSADKTKVKIPKHPTSIVEVHTLPSNSEDQDGEQPIIEINGDNGTRTASVSSSKVEQELPDKKVQFDDN